MRKTHTKE